MSSCFIWELGKMRIIGCGATILRINILLRKSHSSALNFFHSRRELNSKKSQRSEMASKVVVLTTGGTIDKEYPRSLGGYGNLKKKYSIRWFLAFEFGVETAAERIAKRANAKLHVEKVCALDSQDMTDSEREIFLSKILQSENTNFVITHGTDTLIETAQFLKKHVPSGTIVLIGAKLPEVFKVEWLKCPLIRII